MEVNQVDLWKDYFKQANQDQFTLYFHRKFQPTRGFQSELKDYHPKDVPTIPTNWGKLGIWEAMNSLLKEALKDPANKKFVFVSQACIPVMPF